MSSKSATMVGGAQARKYHAMTKAEREEFTKALIEAVRLHPAIWQMENGVYRDNGRKAKAWYEIAQALGQTEQVCQTTWKNARAYYSKIKREKAKRSEELEEPLEDCFWVHFKAMEFVGPYVDDRQGKYRLRKEAAEDDDAESLAYSDVGLAGLSMVLPSTSGPLLGSLPSRSATSTPSSGLGPNASPDGGPSAKRRREAAPSAASLGGVAEPAPATPAPALGPDLFGGLGQMDLARFDAYIEAVVAKKVFSVLPPTKPTSPGQAFGNFIGIILDNLPENVRNEKVVHILSLINHKVA